VQQATNATTTQKRKSKIANAPDEQTNESTFTSWLSSFICRFIETAFSL